MENYNLARLTQDAAVQIDNYLLGRSSELGAVDSLATKVQEPLPRIPFVDSCHLILLRAMMEDPNNQSKPLTLEEYKLQLALLGYDLAGARELPTEKLAELRGFLVHTSRYFLASAESFKHYMLN